MGILFPAMPDVEFRASDAGYRTACTNTIACVLDLIRLYSGRITIITGAGISSHVLPTFRSNHHSGLWDVLATPVLAKENFASNPLPCWQLAANVRALQIRGALNPSPAHQVIHEMVKRRLAHCVITQNVDSLHTFPGDEDAVVELHGCVTDYGLCEQCGELMPVDHLRFLEDRIVPTCGVCGRVLKPPVAFFRDSIPKEVREAAERGMQAADLVFLVGTHCAVDPVMSMVADAKRRGVVIVEINPEVTHASPFVDVVIRDTADAAFREIAAGLMPDLSIDS
jgi:NAD-dependent deacetylase